MISGRSTIARLTLNPFQQISKRYLAKSATKQLANEVPGQGNPPFKSDGSSI